MKQQIKEQIYNLRERNIEQIAHFISESDIHSDDLDLIIQQIPILIYLIQGDDAFDWCFNMLIHTNDSDFKKYAWIIEEIGYRSDGFSLDFIQKVFSIIHDTTIPARIRGPLAIGAVRHDVFFRENTVYDVMYDICQYCMSPNLDKEFILWFSSKNNSYYILPRLPNIDSSFDRIKLFSGFQKPLIKRKLAIEQYKDNKLLIQDSLLENIVSGRTKGSKYCLEIGFNSENLEILRSLFLTLWGYGNEVPRLNTPNSITIRSIIPSLKQNYYKYGITIVWEKLVSGIMQATKFAPSGDTIIENDMWCDCSRDILEPVK